MFKIKPIKKYDLCCPKCQKAVLNILKNSTVVPGGGYWTNGGDTNGEFYKKISTPNFYYSEINKGKKLGSGFVSDILFGCCRECDCDYYVLSLSFSNTDFETAEPYLFIQKELKNEKNFVVCTAAESYKPWILHKYFTEIGILHFHTFGPFNNEDDSIFNWDYACDLLLPIWKKLYKICIEENIKNGDLCKK